ncbi:MAG TPA: Xaa-Pro peptidase family protein [Candidatus Limnocylindrales bacterium]|nr:Xaa-Pro peptidase family protein [Candidatus Limnocylindrales bacterium]
MTPISRRNFLHSTAAASAAALAPPLPQTQTPPAFSTLKPLGDRVRPITADEFHARLLHAQSLMAKSNPAFDAILIGPGTSLFYFSGIRWWLSERLLALVIPRTGQPILISPAFEESRMRESLLYSAEVRAWQEDESPSQLLASSLADRGLRTGRIGIEERLPFTFFDHFRAAAPAYDLVSADPITIGCRAVKSSHELELMRLACEATCDVYRAVFANLKEGMTQEQVSDMVVAGYAKMHLRGDALVLFGPSAALPHGSKQPRTLKEGDVVLIDDGCTVEGYCSDVTRTGIFGKPSDKIQRAFETVRKAQDAALDAARSGKLSGSVDDAARAVVTSAGYGPGYKFFAHRVGHGIGLDIHEHPYLVDASRTVLEPGMTFSDEPGIYVPNEFGVRCEDLMAITADGPAQLLTPGFQVSLEKPLG